MYAIHKANVSFSTSSRCAQNTHTRARTRTRNAGCIAQRNLLQSICDTNIFYVYIKKPVFAFWETKKQEKRRLNPKRQQSIRGEKERWGNAKVEKLSTKRNQKTRTQKEWNSFCWIRFLSCMPCSNEEEGREQRKTEMAQIIKYHYKSSFATVLIIIFYICSVFHFHKFGSPHSFAFLVSALMFQAKTQAILWAPTTKKVLNFSLYNTMYLLAWSQVHFGFTSFLSCSMLYAII